VFAVVPRQRSGIAVAMIGSPKIQLQQQQQRTASLAPVPKLENPNIPGTPSGRASSPLYGVRASIPARDFIVPKKKNKNIPGLLSN
jgi:hypothetical protein